MYSQSAKTKLILFITCCFMYIHQPNKQMFWITKMILVSAVSVVKCKVELRQANILWSSGNTKGNVLLYTHRDPEDNGFC